MYSRRSLLQVMRFTKHESDAQSEQMLQTKLEIKNRSRDNHHFKKVQVSRLNVLVSYKVQASRHSVLAQCLLLFSLSNKLQGPNLSWNLRDINDLEVCLPLACAPSDPKTTFAQLSVNKIEFQDETWTWAEMFEQVKLSVHTII